MPTVPLGDDRRIAIADAAIRLVASRGLRGLTHRAVDTQAGLPPGSTSYYLRTRDALLTACVDRLLQRDLDAGVAALPSAAELPDLLTALVVDIATHRSTDQIARYELTLESVRRPDLRTALVQAGTRLRELLADALTAYGVPDARAAAWPMAALLDGLVYDRLAGAGSSRTPSQFATATRLAVTAALDGLTASSSR